MTLKQLQAFYWAATCPSFATAAHRLHLTVSSLSTRLTELEHTLGQPLFDRRGHKAALTPAGERLLPLAADLLARADSLRQHMAPQPGLQGQCRVGSGELAALTWVPQWVHRLHQSHPGLQLSLTVDIGDHLADRLERRELDVAVIAGPARRPLLASQPLAQAHFVWCASPALASTLSDPDLQNPAPDTAETQTTGAEQRAQASPERWAARWAERWAAHTLVCLPRGSGVTQVMDAWWAPLGVQARAVLTCTQWGAVARLIALGAGIGLLPRGLAADLAQRGQLCTLPTPHTPPPLDYSLQWHHDDPRPLITLLRHTCSGVADFDGGRTALRGVNSHRMPYSTR